MACIGQLLLPTGLNHRNIIFRHKIQVFFVEFDPGLQITITDGGFLVLKDDYPGSFHRCGIRFCLPFWGRMSPLTPGY